MDDRRERLQRLLEERKRIDREIERLERELSAEGCATTLPRRPVREVLLDALSELGFPAFSRQLRLYVKARYGREIPQTRFGTLASDEVKAFHRGTSRAVWLCFALLADRFERIGSLWARSDWPLEWRVVCPTTARVQHLRMTIRLSELALRAEEIAADPTMLRILAADHARDLPQVRVIRGRFDLERWIEVARRELDRIEPEDEERRRAAAARLQRMPLHVQLFGIPPVIEGGRADAHPHPMRRLART